MIHVSTGNRLDVVFDYEDGKQVIKGLKPWGGELIPLFRPEALVDVLANIIADCNRYNGLNMERQ